MSKTAIVNTFNDAVRLNILWAEAIQERNYRYQRSDHWWTSKVPLVPLAGTHGETIALVRSSGDFTRVYVVENTIVRLTSSPSGEVTVEIWGKSDEDCGAVWITLRQAHPAVRPKEDGSIAVRFWTAGAMGTRSYNRRIVAPDWSEIAANYPASTNEGLAHLMNGYQANAEGGKLLLWHGPPGTGKTFALRALASQWASWCDMHYIIDPAAFFGGSAEYLFDVVLNNDSGGLIVDDTSPDRWKLLVCEDTGELLSADAKQQTGQALSRFLNLCDGLVGQGLNVQILVTTNDEISKFHPAVIRNGRVASDIKFGSFDREAAGQWFKDRDPADLTESQYTLAQLYALARGEDLTTVESVGF